MGADNWRSCPRCKVKAEAAHVELGNRVQREYGTVPQAEWLLLRDAAAKPLELDESFREDYEIGMTDSGQFFVKYSGRCVTCGWGCDYKDQRQIL